MFKYLLSYETGVRILLLPNSNAESGITGIRSNNIIFVFPVMSVFGERFFSSVEIFRLILFALLSKNYCSTMPMYSS